MTQPTGKPTDRLLHHPDLWRAGQLPASNGNVQPSTFAALDAHLPGGGWPLGGLCELALAHAGIGELQVLSPALARLSDAAKWIIWINPPFLPYPPALQAHGIDTRKVLVVHPRPEPDGRNLQALWALERAAQSGNCSAALAWLDERTLNPRALQRLQVAARQGGTFSCLFRPERSLKQPSMAGLRLHLEKPALTVRTGDPTEQHLKVHIAKRRGGWAVADLHIPLHDPQAATAHSVQQQLDFWRQQWRPTDSQAGKTAQEPYALPNRSGLERRSGSVH